MPAALPSARASLACAAILAALLGGAASARAEGPDYLPHELENVGIDDRSGALQTLRAHARDITGSVGRVSAGVTHVGLTAFEGVTLAVSIVVLTHLGLVDEPRVRHRIGSLLYRDDREHFLRATDRIIQTTSRYMLGNLAISRVAGPSTA